MFNATISALHVIECKLVVFENLQFKGSEMFDNATADQLPE